MVLEANPCAPGDPEPKETCKQVEKAVFPQTTRDLKYRISAVPHRGTLEISP